MVASQAETEHAAPEARKETALSAFPKGALSQGMRQQHPQAVQRGSSIKGKREKSSAC
jgi:hypothetical protein